MALPLYVRLPVTKKVFLLGNTNTYLYVSDVWLGDQMVLIGSERPIKEIEDGNRPGKPCTFTDSSSLRNDRSPSKRYTTPARITSLPSSWTIDGFFHYSHHLSQNNIW